MIKPPMFMTHPRKSTTKMKTIVTSAEITPTRVVLVMIMIMMMMTSAQTLTNITLITPTMISR